MFTNDRVCHYCNCINNDRDIHVKETELPLNTTPTAPRARNTSDINDSDAKALIASFASLEQVVGQQQPVSTT